MKNHSGSLLRSTYDSLHGPQIHAGLLRFRNACQAQITVWQCTGSRIVLHGGTFHHGICRQITDQLSCHMPSPDPVSVVEGREKLLRLSGKCIHFWEGFDWFGAPFLPLRPSNALIATWHHGHTTCLSDRGWDGYMRIQHYAKPLARIHCTNNISRAAIVSAGISPEKIVLIPQGVDTARYYPVSDPDLVRARRSKYGVPLDIPVIGYFQNDTLFSEESLVPALEKGPDIFVQTVQRLHAHSPVHVLLTSRRRGFVKAQLQSMGIPFTYAGVVPYKEMGLWYQMCDLYMVTSRDEGGPAALLEAMACGVPLISTRMGMAPDIIKHEENGLMCDVEDVEGLAEAAKRMITDLNLRCRCVEGGLRTAIEMNWQSMAVRYWKELYQPLLEN